MDFAQVIKDRYSCKKYDGKPVTAEQLSSILEAGRLAPTAKNLQEQHIYVVQSAEGLAKIDKLTPCRYGAPTVLVVAFNKGSVFTYPGGKHSSGAEDAANAAVDSCWINFFDPEAAAKTLGLPENEEVLMLLDLGHAAEDGKPLPNHSSRKALTETVSYL